MPLTAHGAMIDWNAVLATLPDQFTLDTTSAHKAANEKPRAYLRQVVYVGRRRAASNALPAARTGKPDSKGKT